MGNFINRAGQRYGTLTVLDEFERRPKGRSTAVYWKCRCDCGNILFKMADTLIPGMRSNCGCAPYHGIHYHTHQQSNSPEYVAWQRMKQRCLTPNIPRFEEWGGRGIKICDRWVNSFENFLADMGFKPTLKHQLDRIDNDGNYEPGNCRWATSKQQSRNTRRSRKLTLNGETLTVAEWVERTGIPSTTIRQRLDSHGWSIEKALTTPVYHKK